MSSEHVCETCNKQFSNASNLRTHLKNAVYCKKLKEDPDYSVHSKTCEGCSKVFDTKHNYERHTDICKDFAVYTVTQKFEKEIQALKQELEEKDNLLKELCTIPEKIPYNVKFNKLLNKLVIFSEETLKTKISALRGQYLLTMGENNIITNFTLYISNVIKDYAFCTDISRNKIVIKRKNNAFEKMNASFFIVECFTVAQKELLILLSQANQYCKTQVNNLTPEDYTNYILQLINLNTYITQTSVNSLVKSVAKKVVTSCTLLSNE